MNIPITSRVKRAGKKGCGCPSSCSCGKTPAKKLTDLSGDNKITQKDVLIGRGVIPAPNKKYAAPSMLKKNCGMKY